MAGPAELAPVTISGVGVALFISSIEMPISKVEIMKTAKTTEVTGSTSGAVVAGAAQIFQEFSPGPSGGSLRAEGHWRVGQAISPPMLRQGAIYDCLAYVRRPGFNNAADAGNAYHVAILVQENNVTLDPNSGSVDWRLSAVMTGVLLDPAQ